MSYKRNSLLFNYAETLLKRKINFIDVGARGDISQPFRDFRDKYPEHLKVFGFEPDPDECGRLNDQNLNDRYFPVSYAEILCLTP